MRTHTAPGATLAVALTAAFLASTACSSQADGTSTGAAADARLVVVVAVDQLRTDMIERFDPAFVGGFRRLIDDGFSFTEAFHDHGVTHTGAGHAALSTGVYPRRNGIVANDWQEFRGGEWVNVYSVEDGDSPLVGVDTGAGRSPRNLERSGLADWVVASQEDARVASFSRKDRSAITLAGQAQGDVYWASSSRGVFVSSTFYRSDLPGWVEDYNAVDMAAITANTEWESLIPAAFVPLSRPDTSDYETARVSYFPHRVEDEYTEVTDARRNTWLMEKTPAADVATFGLAARAIRELELGQRGEMDFLAVSFSATDGVGHAYGPFSREQLDNLMRLDRLLGDLMDLLDEEVGEGEWVLGLSSDHGILEIPETISDPPTGRITREDRREMQVAVAAAGVPGDDEEEYAERLAAALSEVPIVARATPVHQLEAAAQTDTTSAFEANSFRPDRRVGSYAQRGVVVRYQDRVLAESGTGTTHGSPYSYDRHVPLIFYGAGIPAGRSTERARTVDFAPTLATLLGIDFPEDLDGRPLFPFRPDALPQRP